MFSIKMREIYKRFLILGLLLMCLFVFGFSDKIETAHAAVCMQDCDKYHEICDDNCQSLCATGSRDTDCNSCVISCAIEWNSCLTNSIYCTNGTVTYDPQCEVNFGRHCIPDSNGDPQCEDTDGAHNGYFQICDRIGYAEGCIVCPNGEICQGGNSGELPHCL